MPCQAFPRFLEFPGELQIQIWKEAIEAAQADAQAGSLDIYNISDCAEDSPEMRHPVLQAPYTLRQLGTYYWSQYLHNF